MIGRVLVAIASLFALLPGLIVFAASFTSGRSLAFPPQGFSFRWYLALIGNDEFASALTTSVALATVTSALAVALSVPASIAIVRHRLPGSTLIESFLLSPLAIPHVVIGIGILQIYGVLYLRTDLTTLTLGHLIVTIPFVLRILMASLVGLDRSVEMAAASLGATPTKILFTIVLPQMRVAVMSCLIAAFILSFDDLALTIFLVQPGYTTVPVMLFNMAENSPLPTIHAASVVLLAGSWIGVFAIDRLVGFERFTMGGR